MTPGYKYLVTRAALVAAAESFLARPSAVLEILQGGNTQEAARLMTTLMRIALSASAECVPLRIDNREVPDIDGFFIT